MAALKSPILCCLFSSSSSRPISNFSQRSQLSLNPVRFTGFKACFSCNSCSYRRNFSNDLGWRLNADRIRTYAVSGGDSGGSGGLGGSGNGNSGGGGETGGGDAGENNRYLEMVAAFAVMFKFLTPALLNCIGDVFSQLVIEEASSLDVTRTVICTSMGLPLVGHTVQICSLLNHGLLAFFEALVVLLFIWLAMMSFSLLCCIVILVLAYKAIRKCALKNAIKSLPKYEYCLDNRLRRIHDDGKGESIHDDLSNELSLLPEESECCICLCRYEEGEELNVLACKHHFHCDCISQWLQVKPTCPVCICSIFGGRY